MKYFKQLDSVRAIAVFLVILCHWLQVNALFTQATLETFGAVGVNTFFVLSGFLISGILLRNRLDSETAGYNKFIELKNFYIRRALRIFPVYYLMICILFIFRQNLGDEIGSELVHSLTYTINFYFYKNEYWSPYTTHFWSLAVEEQFYLVWPWIILFVQKQRLIYALAAFILVGIITQCVTSHDEFGIVLTYTCFDSFGLGALLAWIMTMKPQMANKFYRVLSSVTLFASGILVAELVYGRWLFIPQRTLHSIVALWLITNIVFGRKPGLPFVWRILDSRALMFIGRISYGIYLYHLVLPQLTAVWLRVRLNRLLPPLLNDHQFYIIFVLNLILLLVISWVSWILIEQPVLKLKKRFHYQQLPVHI